MKRCHVLMVNWNGWANTIECLESLIRATNDDVRIILCDNGSSDDSVAKILAWAEGGLDLYIQASHPLRKLSWPPVVKPISVAIYDKALAESGGRSGERTRLVIIRNGVNLGFAGGNNVGLRYLQACGDFDYVWLLNNDTVVTAGALEALCRRVEDAPKVGMCGATLLRYDAPEKVQARGGGWYCRWIGLPWHVGQLGQAKDRVQTNQVERRINYIVGASLLVSRLFLEQIGLLAEDYFLYFEEADWARRSDGQFDLGYASHSTVYHKVGASIGTSTDPRKKSLTCDYYSIRNRIRFTRRYHPVALFTVYLVLCLAILNRLMFGQWRRALMVLRLMLARGRDLETMKPGN